MIIERSPGECIIVPGSSAIDRVEVEYGEYEYCVERGFGKYTVWYGDGSKRTFDRSNCSFVRNWEPYHIIEYGLSFTEDGRMFLSGNWDKGLFAVDSYTGETVWHYKKSRIRNIFVFRDYAVVLRFGVSVIKLDLHSGELLNEIPGKSFESCWRIDERHVMLDRKYNSLYILNSETMSIVKTIPNSVFNPRDCLSCCVQDAWMEDKIIMIKGFEQYPNRNRSLSETANFIRALGVLE